jgi:hypothetical protein
MTLGPASAASGDLFDQVTSEVAAERVTECGLGPVTIRYDDLLQEEILTAAGAIAVTELQLECADRAASYYDLELPAETQPRYDAIRDARLSAHSLAEARSWLSQRGLLERVPQYKPGETDPATFTREAEELCGPRAEGAFQSQYGPHAINPDWAQRTLGPVDGATEVLECLLSVTRVAGYDFYLIGNEKMAVPD